MKIALVGDIGLFGKYTLKNPNIKKYFKEISDLLSSVDYVVGNLEVPVCVSGKAKWGKSAHLKTEPENIELLKYLNITHVSLANNHLYDYGKKGFEETIEHLESSKIKYFGVNDKVELIENGSNKVALSGYVCYTTNALGYLENRKNGVNELDYNKVRESLLNYTSSGYFNIVSFHIGEEHVHYPNLTHVRLAHKLSQEVPFVFHGHHPHVLQGVENFKNSLHLYSLGNFCFDDVYTNKSKVPLITQKKKNKESCIVVLNIENSSLSNYEIFPIYDDGNLIRIEKTGAIAKKIEKYSSYLKLDQSIYQEKRNLELKSYLQERIHLRNISWYFKRLNFKSLKMILDIRRNRKKFKKVLKDRCESA